jgi:AraC-like DNA-binding protein
VAAALRRLNAADLLSAGTLLVATVAREPDAAAAARRAAAMLEAILLEPGSCLPPSIEAVIERAADALLELSEHPPPSSTAARILAAVWSDVAGRLEVAPATAALRPVDAAIQEHLAAHLDERTSLRDLARDLGYSESHVSTLVRRVTGHRFSVLRRRMQLERACSLLAQGMSIKAVALGSGFSDPAYFTRVFRQSHGVAPSSWRRRSLPIPARRRGLALSVPARVTGSAMPSPPDSADSADRARRGRAR